TSERHKLCRAGPGRRRMVGGVGLVCLVSLVCLVCLVGLLAWCVWLVLLRRVWPCGVWVFGVSQIGGLTVPDWSCIVHVDSELTAEERKAERRLQARHLRPTGADRSPVRGSGGEPLRQPRRMRGPVSADQSLLRRVQGPPWWWTYWTTEACPARP